MLQNLGGVCIDILIYFAQMGHYQSLKDVFLRSFGALEG